LVPEFGQQALVSILAHLAFIGVAWWAIQAIQLDRLLKKNHVIQARILYILLAIALGSIVSNFFLDYLMWSQQLPMMFQ
jgi:uncharacterized integral membrane protein (TIGR02327 family)